MISASDTRAAADGAEPATVDWRAAPTAAEAAALYRPPAPYPVSPTRALLRAIVNLERDLITLLPAEAYRALDFKLGSSRRGIYMINAPETVRLATGARLDDFPKNDLMVGALKPVVGESIFVSSGALWERQRRMTEPAFGQLRINRAFVHMAGAMADGEARFDAAAARGERLSLEAEMSHLTADMIYRTIFSEPLAPGIAGQVFDAFARFQRAVANVELRRLLFSPAWQEIPQPAPARRAATEIRNLLAEMLRARRSLMASGSCPDDIAADIVAARDPETGEGFTDEEMLDQLGVFFMAGHETTASVLTWAVFMLSQQPGAVSRMRREIDAVAGDGPIALAHIKRLAFTRAVFRETLRLYPPVTFLARVAMREGPLGALTLPRGAMVLISPWTIQRHEALWPHADRFDPDRFSPERESEIAPGTYLPFGIGPRVCIGSGFAMMEAGLILASLIRRYDVETMAPGRVRAVARLTTRPARDISVRLRRRGGA